MYALRKLGWTVFPLPSYEARCLLINIQTLKERRDYAMVSFVTDIVSQRTDSPELLSKLIFYAPSRHLRERSLFTAERHHADYAKYGPLNQMMYTYNRHCEMIDLNMTRTQLKKHFQNIRNRRS